MEPWLVYVVIAFVLWGVGGFISKLALNDMSPERVLGYQIVGTLLTGVLMYPFLDFKFEASRGAFLGIIVGVIAITGGLFYLISINLGNVSVVTVISALYPLVTILLAFFFLKEPITLKHGMGMALALAAMMLLSS